MNRFVCSLDLAAVKRFEYSKNWLKKCRLVFDTSVGYVRYIEIHSKDRHTTQRKHLQTKPAELCCEVEIG